MNVMNNRVGSLQKYWIHLLLIAGVIAVGIGYGVNTFARQQRQAEIAVRGAQVMPFDLDKTTHTFVQSEDGGIQTVTANDADDQEQVRLIREHLRTEGTAFSRGDFADPGRIHGEDMPGLKALSAGVGKINVAYSDLPNGARLTYSTDDISLVHALHQWFDAQVSDHGEHAQDGMHD
jgi:hypothetical protein